MSAAVTRSRSQSDDDLNNLLQNTDLSDIQDLLVRSGAGPLAWSAIRTSRLAKTDSLAGLQDSYRAQVMRAALAEQELERLFRAVNEAGISPILGKGWAVARSYPDTGLRPYGDFDLYVAPVDYERLRQVVTANSLHGFQVDVHNGASYLDDREFAQLIRRSVAVPIGSTQVRVFSAEDQLRLVCLHALAEGVIRPLWLCDVAFLIQSLPPSFDWTEFRAGDRRHTDWAFAAIGLMHQVLGVDVSNLPDVGHVRSQPGWLAQTVMRVWGEGPKAKGARLPIAQFRGTGRGFGRALIARWPNPIEATIGVKGGINAMPRLPYQLADCVRRMGNGNIGSLLKQFTRGRRQ